MRRMALSGMAASLVICLSCSTAWAGKDTYQSSSTGSTSKWWWPFGSKKKEPVKKPAAKNKPKADADKTSRPTTQKPEPLVSVAEEREKFLRRQQVCDRLREIALETNNPSLETQAQLLEQEAWIIYEQRTLRGRSLGLLPADGSRSAAVPAAGAGGDARAPTEKDRRTSERPIRSVSTRGPEHEEN